MYSCVRESHFVFDYPKISMHVVQRLNKKDIYVTRVILGYLNVSFKCILSDVNRYFRVVDNEVNIRTFSPSTFESSFEFNSTVDKYRTVS